MYSRDAQGSLFCFGAGQRKKFTGWGGAGQGIKCLGRGGVTAKLGAFFGWGGAGQDILENFWGRGGPGQPFSPGSGRGVHPWCTDP